MIYLVNFATKEFYESQEKLNQSALKFGVDKAFSYRKKDIIGTNFYKKNKEILDQKRGAGYWLWKPYIILEALKKADEGDVVIYADSGIEVIKDLTPLINLCRKKQDVVIFCDGGENLNKTYIKRDCFVLMDCDEEKYWNASQCLASFQIYIKNEKCVRFVEEWLSYCENRNILTDAPNVCGKGNFEEFKDHRHDQAVLTLLAYKKRKEIFRDPTQWGNHLKLKEYRETGEFLLRDYEKTAQYTNSPYSTFLNHHRIKKLSFKEKLSGYSKKIFVKISKATRNIYKSFIWDKALRTNITCPVCNSSGATYIWLKGKNNILACRNCLNAWTVSDIDKKYEEEDFHGQFQFKKIGELPVQWRKGIESQIKIIKDHLKEGSTILEIGCGQGLLLDALKNMGFKVEGVEPSESAYLIAKSNGLDVIKGYFPENKPEKKFDLVVAAHVLEHVRDYDKFIKEIKSSLNEGGKVLFVQANWRGLMPRLFREKWYGWAPEYHYWHFTASGLEYIIKKRGFKTVKTAYYSLDHNNSLLSRLGSFIPRGGDQFHLLAEKHEFI